MSDLKNRPKQWQDILQLTGQLKQMLVDENWQAMSDLESKRLEMLKAYFAHPVSPDEAEGIAAEIHKMMHINQKIIGDGQAKQHELISAAKQVSTNRQAIDAYHNVQK